MYQHGAQTFGLIAGRPEKHHALFHDQHDIWQRVGREGGREKGGRERMAEQNVKGLSIYQSVHIHLHNRTCGGLLLQLPVHTIKTHM